MFCSLAMLYCFSVLFLPMFWHVCWVFHSRECLAKIIFFLGLVFDIRFRDRIFVFVVLLQNSRKHVMHNHIRLVLRCGPQRTFLEWPRSISMSLKLSENRTFKHFRHVWGFGHKFRVSGSSRNSKLPNWNSRNCRTSESGKYRNFRFPRFPNVRSSQGGCQIQ